MDMPPRNAFVYRYFNVRKQNNRCLQSSSLFRPVLMVNHSESENSNEFSLFAKESETGLRQCTRHRYPTELI